MKPLFSSLLAAGLFAASVRPSCAQTVTNTIVHINYESGTTSSGISGINATNAPASDAATMVQPGATGNWAIAHKIVEGDAGYFSDGNYRSEADAIAYLPARFSPGDERRYEFSVLLKDWVPWNTGEPPVETNLFQLKMSDGNPVPLMIRTTRNALRLRYGNMDGTITTKDIIADLRSYVNQWMHFRIDVKWTMDNTGYITTYMKLPGQSDYVQADQQLNRRTFTGDPAGGNVGYIKWGLYVAPEATTRIAYHDDIRIFELNNASTPVALWTNPVTDPNPAYQPGRYAPGSDVVAANVVNNSTAPSSDFSRTTLTPAGGNTLSGRYLLSGWVTGTAVTPSPLNKNQYYEFEIAPEAGYYLKFTSFKFTVRNGNRVSPAPAITTNPTKFALRSSLDNFQSDIGAPVDIGNSIGPTVITFSPSASTGTALAAASIPDVTGPVTFQLYAYGATGSGTMLVGLDDFQFNGLVFQQDVLLPVLFAGISARFSGNDLHVNWSTASETNGDHFEIQASRDGKNFTTLKTVRSQNGTHNTGQHYEALIAGSEMAGLMVLPLLIGLLGIAGSSRRRTTIWLVGGLCWVLAGASCSKYREGVPAAGDGSIYIRIKQVDVNGGAQYSKVVLATASE